MKKKLLVSAVAMAMLPTVSLADVSIYGRAHVSLDYLDDGADYGEVNLSSNASRLGFKAQTELANLTAFVQIEQEINFAQGKGADWAGRDTFVGIKGDNWGMVRAGQFDSPFKAARGPANLFGDQVGDMRNLTRVGDARFDERLPNTIHYQTPRINGLQFNVAYSVHDGTDNGDGTKEDAYSVSVTYQEGIVDGALAFEAHNEDKSRGERQAARLAVGVKVADPVKLVAFYQNVDHKANDTLDSDTYGVGGEFKAAENTALKAMYLHRKGDDSKDKADMIAVGVEHKLANPLRVYANYAMVMNKENSALTPWNQARTTSVVGVAGEDASGFSLGLRYDF